MKSFFESFKNILLIVLFIGILYLIFFHKPKPTIEYQDKWKTDTFYVKEYYAKPEPFPIYINPKTVIIYETDQAAIDSLTVLLDEQNILIQGLNSQISISQNYLKQFPRNPKLIELNLQRDTLSLSLLNIQGIVYKEDYPIFLNSMKYNWSDFKLTSKEYKPLEPHKPFLNYRVGIGYEFLKSTPYISGTIQKDFSRIILYSRIDIGLLNVNANEIKLGIDYKIFKNAKN